MGDELQGLWKLQTDRIAPPMPRRDRRRGKRGKQFERHLRGKDEAEEGPCHGAPPDKAPPKRKSNREKRRLPPERRDGHIDYQA